MNEQNLRGRHRILEPRHGTLLTAWKLSAHLPLADDEMLVDVDILQLNTLSFMQLLDEAEGDETVFSRKLLDIVKERGKLHNPITGTGGILTGKIVAFGRKHPNPLMLEAGDRILSLVSLSGTPLALDRIERVDFQHAQVHVKGKAILFSNSVTATVPGELSLSVALSCLDEAGAPMQTARLVKPEHRVLIMGGANKLTHLCAFAAHHALGGTGVLAGWTEDEASSRDQLELGAGLYNQMLYGEMTTLPETERFDVVVCCSESAHMEEQALSYAREEGHVFFASLGADCKVAGLAAETLGREVAIVPYRGYMKGHAAFVVELLHRYPELAELIERGHGRGLTEIGQEPSSHFGEMIAGTRVRDRVAQIIEEHPHHVFASRAMQEVLADVVKVARYDCIVLIQGASGTGKEILSEYIFSESSRSAFSFIRINCAAIPEQLLESELFGYEKGAFSGADPRGKKGLWEMAQGGTLFLDEIGDLPLAMQAKLLRVIQNKEIYRVGGTRPVKVDVRLIAATHCDLAQKVEAGTFRADLFYRLSGYPITIPPLSARSEDIVPLAELFIGAFNRQFGMKKSFAPELLEALKQQPWPGNVRELQNFVQRLLIRKDEDRIESDFEASECWKIPLMPSTPVEEPPRAAGKIRSTAESEEDSLRALKAQYKTTRRIAEAMGISQSTVSRRLRRYGL